MTWSEALGISGRRIGSGPQASVMLESGRLATEDVLRVAAAIWPQARPGDLDPTGEAGLLRLRPTGSVYRRIDWDPLSRQEPAQSSVSLFTVDDDEPAVIRFYERAVEPSPEAVAEREHERDRAEQARRAALAAEPQTSILMGDDRAEANPMTLRAAWVALDEVGGQVGVGEFGELSFTLPSSTPRPQRSEAAQAARVLLAAERVVRFWIEDGRNLATLPERRVTIGGGCE